MKLCPSCSNLSPPEAARCECGFEFSASETKESRTGPERTATSDPKRATSSDGTGQRTVFALLSIYMIATFLWRMFVPGGEYPMRPAWLITVSVDLLLVGILIRLKANLSAQKKPGKRMSTGGTVLFWIALSAGLGVLAIRLHGDASWWTGHFSQEKLTPYLKR